MRTSLATIEHYVKMAIDEDASSDCRRELRGALEDLDDELTKTQERLKRLEYRATYGDGPIGGAS